MDNRLLSGFDVVVVGGGSAGVPAAIAAARNGTKTLLVEKTTALGGIVATGMPAAGFLDRQLTRVVGGIPQEIVDDLKAIGASTGSVRCPVHNSITTVNGWWYKILAAKKCREAGVEVLFATDLVDVKVVDASVRAVKLVSGSVLYEVPCRVVVDATGDALAAYFAGAKYEYGQPETLEEIIRPITQKEKRYDIGHSKAGKVQPVSMTFNLGNIDTAAFRAYAKEHPDTYKSPEGYGMQYDAEYVEHSPAIYFTGFWEFIEKAKAAGDFDIPRDRVIIATQPTEGEFMINATRVTDVDPTDPVELSRAALECYRQVGMLTKFFKKYCPGFENCVVTTIGTYVGVRESRRIVGLRTLGKKEIDELQIPDDSIALCGYNVDLHLSGVGLYFQPVEHGVGIPYGCLVSENIDGLLAAGRCISMDSYALALFRAMGTCEALGQAAGTAAALIVKENVAAADLDTDLLRKTLIEQGAIVSLN